MNNGLDWSMMDKFIPTATPQVVNTDISTGPGDHWIVAFINKGEGYVYDPLGPDNHRVTTDFIDSDPFLISAFRAKGIHNIHIYPYASQLKTSALCGWFSIFVATLLRDYLEDYPDTSNEELDTAIALEFGESADKRDEKILEYAFTPHRRH